MSSNVTLKKLDNELAKTEENQQTEQSIIVYQTSGTGRYIYSVFHLIMSLVAIYLSFKCNKGFDMGSFVVAFCCPYIYIIYILATQGTCGILEGEKI